MDINNTPYTRKQDRRQQVNPFRGGFIGLAWHGFALALVLVLAWASASAHTIMDMKSSRVRTHT
jgi:hypothetical protein